ncbi:hypothetical protein, conserved [Eimeria maxima]|uniref:Uncharacterized protein n=1 Tax=Eimeria maxima TaxID=5804 RepID=U6MCW8_EIMMA|nr:hypothetical protein, conserved [Eimeria maxima]CDJ60304.1 hypothetical protein, conserved [Eimeria maxima]
MPTIRAFSVGGCAGADVELRAWKYARRVTVQLIAFDDIAVINVLKKYARRATVQLIAFEDIAVINVLNNPYT